MTAKTVQTERSPGLVARGITKRFGGVDALRGVDFAVQPGQVVCLLGENGAGKSTLSRVIGGIISADSGEVTLDGSPVSIGEPADAYALGIRVVPQELTLVPERSVAENVLLGHLPVGRFGAIDKGAMRRSTVERLNTLSLRHIDPDAPVASLPVVDKAFVQIARAMTDNSRFLIADEPTAPMSGNESDRLLDLLESLKRDGIGVVFVSHRLDEVLRLGDVAVVLRDGANALAGDMGSLTREQIVRAMVGDEALEEMEQPESAVRDRAPADAPVLEVEGLRAGTARSISLAVRPGQILGVYGSTGSGREALGPAVYGATTLEAGTIKVAGRRVRIRSPRDAIKSGIAYVPAERRSQALIPELSIKQNLTLGALDRVSRRGFLRRRREAQLSKEWISRLQLKASSADAEVLTLSGGTQQKVVLARWLMVDTRILILDEPTRGVDIGTKAQIYRILRDCAADGVAVLLISSDAEELSLACDEVLVLTSGSVHTELEAPSQQAILRAANEEAMASHGGADD